MDSDLEVVIFFGLMIFGALAFFGFAAAIPSTPTNEQVCTMQYNVNTSCGLLDGCSYTQIANVTTCNGFHMPVATKNNSLTILGLVLLGIVLYILFEIKIISKARKGEWVYSSVGFFWSNILSLLIVVITIGTYNIIQAWVRVWASGIDWPRTLQWFSMALLWVCVIGLILFLFYVLKFEIWEWYVEPSLGKHKELEANKVKRKK